jgi:3-hydroxyisobutyrate dehydrogenase
MPSRGCGVSAGHIKERTGDGMKKIGMVGVGMMGHGIATNIVKHGYPLTILEHPGNQPLDALLAKGAKTVKTAADLARAVDVLILCVTGSAQVEDVLYRAEGILEGIRPDSIVIDCSTAVPSSTVRIAEAIAKTGAKFIDAPMTRTPKEAAEGRLNLIVGGDREVYEQCKPVLDCFAENIVFAGPVASGHRLKLLHNFVSLGFSALLAEAAACAKQAGVDPNVFVEVLSSGGGEGVILRRLQPYIENGDIASFRFSILNALKDMNYYTTMAKEMGASDATAKVVRQMYERAAEVSAPDATVPELITILSSPENRTH